MAVQSNFTFSNFALKAGQNIVAVGPMTAPQRIRDRFGNTLIAKIGDYIVKDSDGKITVMPPTPFTAKFEAA